MVFEVCFLNWKKWQGRGTEFEQTKWFKMSNQLCYHEVWDQLSPSEFKCFMLLLMLTSQKSPRSGQSTIDLKHVLRKFGVRSCTVRTTLEQGRKMGILEYQEVGTPLRNVHVSQIRIDKKEEIRSEPLARSSLDLDRSNSDKIESGDFFVNGLKGRLEQIRAETLKLHPEYLGAQEGPAYD